MTCGFRLRAAGQADQRLGCDFACASPPLAPPFQGGERVGRLRGGERVGRLPSGERWARGFRWRAARRADQRLGCDFACASPPLAPPLQGGERRRPPLQGGKGGRGASACTGRSARVFAHRKECTDRHDDDLGRHDDRGGQDEGREWRGVDSDSERQAEDRHEHHQATNCFG